MFGIIFTKPLQQPKKKLSLRGKILILNGIKQDHIK